FCAQADLASAINCKKAQFITGCAAALMSSKTLGGGAVNPSLDATFAIPGERPPLRVFRPYSLI
ncbi:MAG: hypothetical protein CME74_07490, partial [Halomonas sp.]|nr:hypothetical protein [Halomonas sp.]